MPALRTAARPLSLAPSCTEFAGRQRHTSAVRQSIPVVGIATASSRLQRNGTTPSGPIAESFGKSHW